MSKQPSHNTDSEDSPSRTYDLILEEKSTNPKVRGAIQEHAGVDRATAEDWMQHPPSVILKAHPLQDVVELRSLLMRLGASVRITEVHTKGYSADNGLEVLSDDDYQVIETIPTVDDQDEVDQSLDQYFPKREKIPTSKVASGSLFSNRLWTCLVSVVVVAIVLSALTVGMFQCMKKEDNTVQKAGGDVYSPSGVGSRPIKLPTLTGFSERLGELTRRANAAVVDLDGAEASRILDDRDNLYEVKELTDALEQTGKPEPKSGERIRDESAEPSGEDAQKVSEDAAEKMSPAVLASLQQLRDRHRLESGLSAGCEVTGTVVSAQTNLPESTRVDVEVRIPGQEMMKYQPQVIKGIIHLPAFDYLPVGTLVIQIQLVPIKVQPHSVQLRFLTSPGFQPEKWGLKLQITLEEERTISEIPTLEASMLQFAELMANNGLDAEASIPKIDADVQPPLVIEGESDDPFLFLNSAVQASGLITETVNDPAPWVLIRVNQVEYWIESYHCREAVRNYVSSDPRLSEYVLNHIYCL